MEDIIVLLLVLIPIISGTTFLVGWWLGTKREDERFIYVYLNIKEAELKELLQNRDINKLNSILDRRFRNKALDEYHYDFYKKYLVSLDKEWKKELEDERNRGITEAY